MMRKAILWILIAVLTLGCCTAVAEGSDTAAINGRKAVRTSSELYMVFHDDGKDVLVRTSPTGEMAYVDRADTIDSVVPYAGGAAYLKTDNGVSSIILVSGTSIGVMYKFEGMTCEKMSVYGDDLLVLSENQIYSVDPNNQVCLKLSGAQILDYCVGGSYAYYLSGTDKMQYSADITENGETTTVTAEVGCIYRLDLTSGETTLMLKSGGTDLKMVGSELYFHSMQQIYALRSSDGYELRGRLYSLNIDKKNLNSVCSAEDSDFFPLKNGIVAWYDGALNLLGSSTVALYNPANGAQVVSDGERLYVWESSSKKIIAVGTDGSIDVLYTGDLSKLPSINETVLQATATPEPTPEATPEVDFAAEATEEPAEDTGSVFADGDATALEADQDAGDDGEWFDEFMTESENVDDASADPTPIGMETPEPDDGEVADESRLVPDSSLVTFAVSEPNITISGSAANVRIGPGTDYEKIGSVPAGKRATSMGIASKASNGTVWYKISYNGLTGWVSSKYAKPSGSASASSSGSTEAPRTDYKTYAMDGQYVHVTGGWVNVRSGPGQEYSKIGSVADGTYLTFMGVYAKASTGVKWYKVSGNGKTGWVSSNLTKVTDSKTSSGSSSSSSSKGTVRTTGDVKIRSSANKTSDVLGYVPSGTNVTYLGKSQKDSRGVRWYKISYNGVTGWISSKFSHIK